MKRITTPFCQEVLEKLQIGEELLLSGIIYGARDGAHQRMAESFQKGEELPIPLEGQVIYYVGPCPAKPGEIIGSAGPTTSGRMDIYTPILLELGLKGMIGKGQRGSQVIEAMQKNGAVYLGAVGGAGALLAQKIKKAQIVAYPELGAEAIWELVVEDFPVVVIIDLKGNNLYLEGPKAYCVLEEKE